MKRKMKPLQHEKGVRCLDCPFVGEKRNDFESVCLLDSERYTDDVVWPCGYVDDEYNPVSGWASDAALAIMQKRKNKKPLACDDALTDALLGLKGKPR